MTVTDWIQAVSAAAVAILTLFLWRITKRYTEANERLAGVLERDLRERYRPSPEVSYEVVQRDPSTFTLDVVLYNRGLAPLRIAAVRITHGGHELANRTDLILAVGATRSLDRVRFTTTELFAQEEKERRDLSLELAIEYRDFDGALQRLVYRPWDEYMARRGRPGHP